MPANNRMMQRAVLEIHLDHLAARLVHGLLHRYRYFTRFTLAHADAAIPISNDGKCSKTKDTPPFYNFGNAIDRYHFLLKTIAAIITLRHFSLHPSLHLSHYPLFLDQNLRPCSRAASANALTRP